MESVIGAVALVFVVVWAFHIDRNLARAAESLERLEKIYENHFGKKEK